MQEVSESFPSGKHHSITWRWVKTYYYPLLQNKHPLISYFRYLGCQGFDSQPYFFCLHHGTFINAMFLKQILALADVGLSRIAKCHDIPMISSMYVWSIPRSFVVQIHQELLVPAQNEHIYIYTCTSVYIYIYIHTHI